MHCPGSLLNVDSHQYLWNRITIHHPSPSHIDLDFRSLCRIWDYFWWSTENRNNTTIKEEINRLTLLLADTNSATSSASGLGMLTSDTETPVVS